MSIKLYIENNMNTIRLLAMLAAWVMAAVAVKGCNDQQQQAKNYSVRIVVLEKDTKKLKGEIEKLNIIRIKQRDELEKNLLKYASHYKEKVQAADAAINYYQSFNTEVNRQELGDKFGERHAEFLKDATIKMQALVDHVQTWKPVLTEFEKMLNGRIESLGESLIGNDIQQAFTELGIIRENVDSNIDRLKAALDQATRQ